jgi:hypothetical protein
MNRPKVWSWVVCAAFLLFSSVLPVRAQNDAYDDPQNDPPGRVARMNFVQGSVSFQPGGEGDWVDAVPNRPMTTGDNLWTDRNARAELHVGSTAIRISSETSLTFLDLDDHATQLRLAQGSVVLNVRHLDDDDSVEIDTPNLSFQVQHNGEYRVDVDPNGRTTLIDVFHGRGEALGGGNNYTVVAGQEARFSGGADRDDQPLSYDIDRLPRDDDFDRWAFDRDRREDRSESASYVSREMTGYEDLDDNGRWDYDATYGHVWIPTRVDAGWAPYREGHWAFVAPWGWTWVDDAPWGFAPFHYGRWCRVRDTWGWIPGPVVVRPVYAPALVAFVGGGGFHLSVGFGGGGGGVAWFPLGPGEVFVPAYHVSRGYVNQVNVTNTVVNVTKITNVYNTTVVNNNTTVINNNVTKIVYVNQRAPNAVTAVSRDTFVNARPVAKNVVQVSQRDIEQAPVSHMTGVEPVRSSVMGSGRPTQIAPPAAVATRQVVAQRPPAPPTVPFAQRQDPLVARGPRPVAPAATGPPVRPMPPNAGRQDSVFPRANQPVMTPAGPPMPNQPVSTHPMPPNAARVPTEARQPIQAPRPEGQRPDVARPDVPRPGVPRPDATRPEQPRTPAPNDEARPQPGWSHPLARPAAPPQPKSPQQAQDEERKFNQWQQRQRSAPPPRPPVQKERPKDEKPKDEKHR